MDNVTALPPGDSLVAYPVVNIDDHSIQLADFNNIYPYLTFTTGGEP